MRWQVRRKKLQWLKTKFVVEMGEKKDGFEKYPGSTISKMG